MRGPWATFNARNDPKILPAPRSRSRSEQGRAAATSIAILDRFTSSSGETVLTKRFTIHGSIRTDVRAAALEVRFAEFLRDSHHLAVGRVSRKNAARGLPRPRDSDMIFPTRRWNSSKFSSSKRST